MAGVRLPNAEQAIIEDAKVRDYLLSPTHPVGQFKAEVFERAGYAQVEWQRLADDLRKLASAGDATPGAASEYGRKFEVAGELEGPSGRKIRIRVVWIVLGGENAPRLVTAYPD